MSVQIGATELADSPLILLAEDEDLVREVVVMMIEDAGGRVLQAEDGLKAVEMFEAHKDEVKAVVMDFSMPGLDGYELAVKLRELKDSIPIIMCSGLQSSKGVQALESMGALRFIGKPYEMTELITALSSACSASN